MGHDERGKHQAKDGDPAGRGHGGKGGDKGVEKAHGKGKEGDDRRDQGLRKSEYLDQLAPLQYELASLARWIENTGQRLVVLFEGRDTAGKGGAINAIAERLNPRRCHVVALGTPSEAERGQWFFQRYVPHLPTRGHLALFDRSWYNRAGVERVMGFCTEAQADAFLEQAPLFEKQLIDDGIRLVKYWLTVDQAEQESRFAERLADPLKRWKLSPIDLQARAKYAEYGRARDQMLRATHTRHAPWTLVDFNDQKRGRLTLIRHLLDLFPERHAPEVRHEMPPLEHPPLKEVFRGGVRPIAHR